MNLIAVSSGQVQLPELRIRQTLSNAVLGATRLPSGTVRSATKTASGRCAGSEDAIRQACARGGIGVGWAAAVVVVGVDSGLAGI
jgi:hypothetical protein